MSGIPPNDPRILELLQKPRLLYFFRRSLEEAENRHERTLGRHLGTLWTAAQVRTYSNAAPATGEPAPKRGENDPFMVPLSVQITAGENIAGLKKMISATGGDMPVAGGDFHPDDGMLVIPMGDTSKDDFLQKLASSGVFPGWAGPARRKTPGPSDPEDREIEEQLRQTPLDTSPRAKFVDKMSPLVGQPPSRMPTAKKTGEDT